MKHIFLLRARTILPAILIFFGATVAVRAAGAPPACDPNQLSFAVDSEGGQFDGMSHSGTLLVLRNLGPNACTVPARPKVKFLDGKRQRLQVSPQMPPGMHPGPVILPVAVPPGAELTSEARWVSSDVFGADNSGARGGGNCVEAAFVTLTVGSRTFTAQLATHLCGPAGRPSYGVTLLRRDTPYQPAKSSPMSPASPQPPSPPSSQR